MGFKKEYTMVGSKETKIKKGFKRGFETKIEKHFNSGY